MERSARRRDIIGGAIAAAGLSWPAFAAVPGGAPASDSVTLAWPSDITSWDPNQRFVPDAQSIYKAVFDQPLMQAPDLRLIPSVLTQWSLSDDALSMPVEMRDDVTFHDGSAMTMEDFRFTFFDRTRPGQGLDIGNSWRKIRDIEVLSPTKGVMRFSSPAPTAPQWLAFLGSFIVPKAYLSQVGAAGFAAKPIGSGPYRLAEYEMNSRIVLERYDRYWGTKARLSRVTVQIAKDPSARVAAVQSGAVDLTINVPIREVARLNRVEGLVAETVPLTRIIMLHVRDDMAFADPRVRLAVHHAIDKEALSKAFYGGAATPLPVFATPGSPGEVKDFSFRYDPEAAKALLAEAGHGADNPVKLGFASTNGHFPSDYDMARALVQMWKRVGIEADLQVIEYAKYFELNRGRKLPELTLYSWDNATADPEIYLGYMMNPSMSFSPAKDPEFGKRTLALFDVANYAERIAGYQKLEQDAVLAGLSMPLLQGVSTVVRKRGLQYDSYANGWVLPQTIRWD